MTVTEALDALAIAEKVVAEHFGLETLAHDLVDFRGHPWAETENKEIIWWYDTTPEEDIDPEDPLFSSEQWRDFRWETNEYTLFYVYEDGYREARVYENACKLG